jgi:membrane protease YdiL (CAAX protease family)
VPIAKKRSLIFLAVVSVLSAVVQAVMLRRGMNQRAFGLPAVAWLMMCPAVAAIITAVATRKRWREFGWRLPKVKYLLMAWVVPMAYAALAYGTVWVAGLGGVPKQTFLERAARTLGMPGKPHWVIIAAAFGYIATSVTLFSCIGAAGEEIGWRGFWLPELNGWLGFRKAALFSGTFWAFWHTPGIVFGAYNAGTPRWFAVPCFCAMVVSMGVFYGWVRLKSDSVWPCVLLHASHNAVIQAFFDRITVDRGHTLWFTTEFGIALVVPAVLIAAWCWNKSAEVEPARIPAAT